jgi:chromosome segregation ATPase
VNWCEMIHRFGNRIDELEGVVREIAIDITTGTFVERLSPEELWGKTNERVSLVSKLIDELKEYLFILKPESVPTYQRQVTGIHERLDVFQETLKMDADDEHRSQVSIDELRQALVEISDFISLCRETGENPSEVINEILTLKENQATGAPPVTQNKIGPLGNLLKGAQASHEKLEGLYAEMGDQLEALKKEYDELYYSLKRKEE